MESNTALNSKISALEDEMRIIKGEVKQVLTEIRSAILVQDSPFEDASSRKPRPIQVVPAVVDEPARVEIVMQRPEPQHAAAEATPIPAPAQHNTDPAPTAHQPQQEHPHAAGPAHATQSQQPSPAHTARPTPRWNLLTVASLAAWAEESLQRLGPQRLAILLDLCEVSGYLPPEARQALGRVTELDVAAPEKPATAMEITLLLRQLDALIQGEANDMGLRLLQ